MTEKSYISIDGKKTYPPTKPHDKDICKYCKNSGLCLYPCFPLQWIDGNTVRKEVLLKEPAEQQPTSDYNEKLSELITDKESKDTYRLEVIRSIKQQRRRLVMACLLVGMTQQEISIQTHISQSRISRIYQGLTTR
jgi:hypothetical protein